jgi:hypothetical protein
MAKENGGGINGVMAAISALLLEGVSKARRNSGSASAKEGASAWHRWTAKALSGISAEGLERKAGVIKSKRRHGGAETSGGRKDKMDGRTWSKTTRA